MNENIKVYPDEFITDINFGIKLIQKKSGLLYGTDALLLAAFIRGGAHCDAAEFGSGSGIVSMLAAYRKKAAKIYAVEIQKCYHDLTMRNIEANGFDETISAVCCDARNFRFEVDAVFTNPPYMTVGTGKRNTDDGKYIARHEVHGNILDFCRAAARVIRFGGSFYAVYRPDRLIDLLCAMRETGIEPKRIISVYNDAESCCALTLIEGRRGGKPSLFTPKPLFLYTFDNGIKTMTDDMKFIYERGEFGDKFIIR